MIETEQLTRKFEGFTAVDDVNWRVKKDDTAAVIGPNGAGKTTFFSMLAGTLSPTSGSISLDDKDITNEPSHQVVEEGLVKTFQVTNLFNELTVEENVSLGARSGSFRYNLRRNPEIEDSVASTVENVITQLQLESHKFDTVENLSYGDQRRVEVGIALATDPKVLLLDEPTAGMSPEETNKFIDIFQSVIGKGSTVVITEHDMRVIFEVADKITVLHNGNILVEGSPEEIASDEQVQNIYLGKGD